MATKGDQQHVDWRRTPGAKRLSRVRLRRPDASATWRDFPPPGSSERPISISHLLRTPRFLRVHGSLCCFHALACPFEPSLEPNSGIHLLRTTAIRTVGLGRAEPLSHVGLDTNAHLEHAVELFFRVPKWVSVQRGQSAAATGGRAECAAFYRLCQSQF